MSILLSACARSADKYILKGTDTPIVDTLELYKTYNQNNLGSCNKPIQTGSPSSASLAGVALLLLATPIAIPVSILSPEISFKDFVDEFRRFDYTVLAEPNVNLECVYSPYCDAEHSSSDSDVCFFNYKKYLPEITNDAEFLVLAAKYKTLTEQGFDSIEIEQKLNIYMNGDLQKEISAREQKRIEAAKKAEQKRIEAAKKAEQKRIEAAKKAEQELAAYQQCRIRANLCKDNNVEGCRVELSGQVLSIHKKGVLVYKEAQYVYVFAPVKVSDPQSFFVYTNKDYISDSYISEKNYYEYVGKFEYKTIRGDLRRVNAYKETNIPVCTR